MSPKKVTLLITSIAIIAVTFPLAIAGAVSLVYQNRVFPRTVVAGINVSNVPLDQALSQLQSKAAALNKASINITAGDNHITTTPSELGATITADLATKQVAGQNTPWGWLSFAYWQTFFKPKNYDLTYQADLGQIQKNLSDKLGLTDSAVSANLQVNGQDLVVVPSKSSQKIAEGEITNLLKNLVSGVQLTNIQLALAESQPAVNDTQAKQLRQQILTTLKPLTLHGPDKDFTLSTSSELSVISFTLQNSQLGWQVDKDKLTSYLTTNVASKINIKMVPKLISTKDQSVMQDGSDGRSVDLNQLVSDVTNAINSNTTTANSVINITVNPVPLVEKQVSPNYFGDLYDGKYVEVNLATQQMFVFQDKQLINTFGVSTGEWSFPTPKGTLYVFNKILLAYSNPFHLWMPYWNGLAESPTGAGYNGYGIHDLPCFTKDCSYREGVGHIGTPVSHGCIRLATDNAIWFYNWADIGTPIVIH